MGSGDASAACSTSSHQTNAPTICTPPAIATHSENALVAATALYFSMALAMLLRVLLRSLEPVHALIATVLAYFLTMPHILARPHILTLPILVAWVAALVRSRGEDRAPSPWLGLLVILW